MNSCGKCGKDLPEDQKYCWGCKPFDPAFEPPQKVSLHQAGQCSNCGSSMTQFGEHIVKVHDVKAPGDNRLAAELCAVCTAGVTKLKVILVRGDDGFFRYDGYLPVESFREPLNAIESDDASD